MHARFELLSCYENFEPYSFKHDVVKVRETLCKFILIYILCKDFGYLFIIYRFIYLYNIYMGEKRLVKHNLSKNIFHIDYLNPWYGKIHS